MRANHKQVWLDPDTHAAVKTEAAKRRTTVQELVRDLIRAELGRRGVSVVVR